MPYYEALEAIKRDLGVSHTDIIHDALDNSPHKPFRKELAKQKEAYGSTQDNSTKGHHSRKWLYGPDDNPHAAAIREEFSN